MEHGIRRNDGSIRNGGMFDNTTLDTLIPLRATPLLSSKLQYQIETILKSIETTILTQLRETSHKY